MSRKFFGQVGHGICNNCLDFGSDQNHNADTGIFVGFFKDYCRIVRKGIIRPGGGSRFTSTFRW